MQQGRRVATIQKRQGKNGISYRVMIRIKGYPPDAATFDRLTDAKRWAAETETAIRAGRHFGVSRRRSFADLASAYLKEITGKLKSEAGRVGHLERWAQEFDGYSLDDIKPATIKGVRDKLLTEICAGGRPRSPATVNRYLATLSAAFTFAVRELEWCESNPVTRVKKGEESDGRVRFLSDDELIRLLKECKASSNEHLYTAVVLALTTGARQSEVLGLRWPQVNFDTRTIALQKHETKNRTARVLPLSGEAFDLLQVRAKVRNLKDDRIFPVPAEGRAFGSLRTAWIQALARAEITDFRWHDLRHTAASYLTMSGIQAIEIAKILGHRTLEMTMRYSHVSPQRTVELGDVLTDRLGLKSKSKPAA